MLFLCNRCKVKLSRPDKRNAHYIEEMFLSDDKELKVKRLIICKKCLKPDDKKIW